jgi:exodeoxyribonuclease-3
MVERSGFVDTFRHFHPLAQNCFSQWSVRTSNRPSNRGLRLDYFLTSKSMVEEATAGPKLHDAWVMSDAMMSDAKGDEPAKSFSDHCPVAVILSL